MRIFYLLSLVVVANLAIRTGAKAQTIRRVNNTPGSSAPFTTIQSALDAASDGDIILVEGSATAYTYDIFVTKKVTIQGPGYFLDQNTGIQSIPYAATLSRAPVVSSVLNFNAGSAGSAVYGMSTSTVNVNVPNVTIANNNLIGIVNLNSGADNIAILGNYDGIIQVNASMNSFLISNNILSYMTMPATDCFGVVTNNILNGGYSHVYNSTFSNNIVTAGPFVAVAATVTKNIFTFDPASYPGLTPVDNTNLINVDYNALFVGLSGHTTDSQFQLSGTSPAKGFGTGGADCGIYGGATSPYKVSGVRPGQPSISAFSSPGSVPQNGILNVKVSAKVN